MDPDNGVQSEQKEGRLKRLLSKKQPSSMSSPKRRQLILGLSLLIVIGVVAGLLAWQWRQRPKLVVCAESIVREANPLLDEQNATKLKQVVDRVKQLKNYDEDINCLYILATYDSNTDNSSQLKSDLASLDKLYDPKNPKVGFSPYFTHASLDTLSKRLEFIEKAQAESKHNSEVLSSGKP